MPLPPALAARLAKRGLLKDSSVQGYDPQMGQVPDNKNWDRKPSGYEDQEEVFAEDYDDVADIPPPPSSVAPQSAATKSAATPAQQPALASSTNLFEKTKYIGHAGCPNKWNIYHECVLYCRTCWGAGFKEPTDTEYIRVHNQMIEKFHPLPDGWREMYDAGTGRHYYWCTKTDKVSWLPPGHPRSKATEAASKVREMLALEASRHPAAGEDEEDNMSLDSDMDNSEDEEDRRLEAQRKKEKAARKEEERRLKEKRKRKERELEEEALDPMDPAAYSDIARGTWSAGLPDQSTAKSGVDSTASGPLFQQRPYPNPGAVLRANRAARDEDDDDD